MTVLTTQASRAYEMEVGSLVWGCDDGDLREREGAVVWVKQLKFAHGMEVCCNS